MRITPRDFAIYTNDDFMSSFMLRYDGERNTYVDLKSLIIMTHVRRSVWIRWYQHGKGPRWIIPPSRTNEGLMKKTDFMAFLLTCSNELESDGFILDEIWQIRKLLSALERMTDERHSTTTRKASQGVGASGFR